jgi:hypothetical protein
MKRLLTVAVGCAVFVVATLSTAVFGENIYIAQTAQGGNTGVDAANAHAITWFNTAANWGAGAGKIGPGDTARLCGTLTSPLTVQSSGTSGSPITILFEPDAQMSAPTWTGAMITATSKNYIVVDGGVNGTIAATANGATLANHNTLTGVSIDGNGAGAQYAEVKNLTIRDLYVRTQNSTDAGSAVGIWIRAGNSSVHHNNITWAAAGINWSFESGQNGAIYSNTTRYASTGIIFGSRNASSTYSNMDIYDNDISDPYVWDQPANNFHHDGVHFWGYGPDVTGLKVHGNYVHGNWGTHYTTQLYFEGTATGYQVYNNVLDASFRHIYIKMAGPGYVYNNTFTGSGWAMDCLTGHVVDFANNIQYPNGGQGYNGNVGTSPTVTYRNNFTAANPLFVNAANADYHLQSGSTAINTGLDLSAYFTTDKDGVARPQGAGWDMGAYEYTSTGLRSAECGLRNGPHDRPLMQNPVQSLEMLRAQAGPHGAIYDLRGKVIDHTPSGPGGIYLVKDQKTGALTRAMVVR